MQIESNSLDSLMKIPCLKYHVGVNVVSRVQLVGEADARELPRAPGLGEIFGRHTRDGSPGHAWVAGLIRVVLARGAVPTHVHHVLLVLFVPERGFSAQASQQKQLVKG